MSHSARRETIGHIKHLIHACTGIALISLGLLREKANGIELPAWRRLVVVGGGLFFLYAASVPYLPENKRRRAELSTLLDEAEAEEREQIKLN
ncbi:MAG: hypothetical protein JST28_07930 [Acidobacteria bacterium]|nr:hypothetical protein [Acidobacteriota bacterium]